MRLGTGAAPPSAVTARGGQDNRVSSPLSLCLPGAGGPSHGAAGRSRYCLLWVSSRIAGGAGRNPGHHPARPKVRLPPTLLHAWHLECPSEQCRSRAAWGTVSSSSAPQVWAASRGPRALIPASLPRSRGHPGAVQRGGDVHQREAGDGAPGAAIRYCQGATLPREGGCREHLQLGPRAKEAAAPKPPLDLCSEGCVAFKTPSVVGRFPRKGPLVPPSLLGGPLCGQPA